MMNLMHDGRWRHSRPERPNGHTLEDLGWTSLSVIAALILLPAIGLKAAATAVVPTKVREPETASLYY